MELHRIQHYDQQRLSSEKGDDDNKLLISIAEPTATNFGDADKSEEERAANYETTLFVSTSLTRSSGHFTA
jgi:hypothetical protein